MVSRHRRLAGKPITAANFSTARTEAPEAAMIEWARDNGSEFVPEAPMLLDAMPEDFGPSVNPRAPWDDVLFNYSTKQIWLGVLALGAAIAFGICGAAYMGVSV
jgi:hypothetical protein